MKDYELVKKILNLINEQEYRQVISRAQTYGFIVPGFSNQKSAKKYIPISMTTGVNVLNAKAGKNKRNYEILMDVMKELAEELDKKDNLFGYVARWIDDERTHEKIEKILVELEGKKQSFQVKEAKLVPIDKDPEVFEQEIIELKERILELQTNYNDLKKRNKKHKEILQSNKIEIENLKQENLKLKRKLEKREEENYNLETRTQQQKKLYEIELNNAKEEVQEQKRTIHTLQEQMEDLRQYKETAPKILCIAKNPAKITLKGYFLCFVTSIDESLVELLKENYDKIWYIRKGFHYADLLSLKDMIGDEKIEQARDEKDFMEKITGGRK